jgi:hypothetical protein
MIEVIKGNLWRSMIIRTSRNGAIWYFLQTIPTGSKNQRRGAKLDFGKAQNLEALFVHE